MSAIRHAAGRRRAAGFVLLLTAMFHAGRNPDHLTESVSMPRTLSDKQRQHGLLTDGLPTKR